MPLLLDPKAAGGPARTRSLPDPEPDLPVTLVLRPPSGFPAVEELCKAPPEQPLTHEELFAKHAIQEADLARIETWAAHYGLQLQDSDWRHRAARSWSVRLVGKPEALRAAFDVADLAYVERGPSKFYTHERSPAASGIEDLVLWVFGLDTRPVMSRHAQVSLPPLPEGLRGYSPLAVAKRYDYPPSDGAGQCIGLIELSGSYRRADLKHYFTEHEVNPKIVNVDLGEPVDQNFMSNFEVTMDIELCATACAGATTVVYNACSSDYSLRDFYEVLRAAIFDEKHRPSVLSVSWAFPECSPGMKENGEVAYVVTKEAEAPFDVLLSAAAMLGITVCASSGDSGSLVALPSDDAPTGAIVLPGTMFPAASPLVLACGGTTLPPDPGTPEVVWNRLGQVVRYGLDAVGGVVTAGGASGGGVSQLNALPAYQEGAGVPEIASAVWMSGRYRVVDRRGGRGVPDVAGNADLNTGYAVYFNGHASIGAGTSAAAPMWAALIARMNQVLGRRVGFVNPAFYQLQTAQKGLFATITHGSNGAYLASDALWNACTGLGSPKGTAIVDALRRHGPG